MTIEAGTEFGAYRIESRLGRGGMGEVYLATHEGLGRKVALKLLASELASDEGFRRRFLAESRLAASLDHPHIVPIYEAGEADGQLFIAMRYVEGHDLGALLAGEGALPPERAIGLLRGVADALDAAHDRGLIHRDVKPGNILVASGPRGEHAYLADFGLTKQAGSGAGFTRTGQLVGSVGYVAPEQIEGRPIDGRVDVYSLACVLWESLAGRPPFQRDSDMAALWAHVQADRPRLSAVRPELASLDEILASGMAVAPEQRPSTAGEMLQAAGATVQSGLVRGLVGSSGSLRFQARGRLRLKGIAEPVAVSAVASGGPSTAAREPARSRRIIVAAIVVGVVVVASLAAIAAISDRSVTREPTGSSQLGGGIGASPSSALTASLSPTASAPDTMKSPRTRPTPQAVPAGLPLAPGTYLTQRFRPALAFTVGNGWTTTSAQFGDAEAAFDLARADAPENRVTFLYGNVVSNDGCIENTEQLTLGGGTYAPGEQAPDVPGSLLSIGALRRAGVIDGESWIPRSGEEVPAFVDWEVVSTKAVVHIDVRVVAVPRCASDQPGVAILRRNAPNAGRDEPDEWHYLPAGAWARVLPSPIGVVVEGAPGEPLVVIVQSANRDSFEEFVVEAEALLAETYTYTSMEAPPTLPMDR